MEQNEVQHIKTEYLFEIYNLYISGLDVTQICHSLEMFEFVEFSLEDINDIIDYLNIIL